MSRSNICPKKFLAGEHLIVQEKQWFYADDFWSLLVVRQTQGEGRMSDRHTFASSVATDFYQQGHVFHLVWPRRDLKLI